MKQQQKSTYHEKDLNLNEHELTRTLCVVWAVEIFLFSLFIVVLLIWNANAEGMHCVCMMIKSKKVAFCVLLYTI